ncbi:unnamed protein product [Gordionus sp. m RMFG-2023]
MDNSCEDINNSISDKETYQKVCKLELNETTPILGMSIRGGKEMNIGIYISNIDQGSISEINGIKVGDQIITVNGYNFQGIYHSKAVKILHNHQIFIIILKERGIIPLYREIWEKIYILNHHDDKSFIRNLSTTRYDLNTYQSIKNANHNFKCNSDSNNLHKEPPCVSKHALVTECNTILIAR